MESADGSPQDDPVDRLIVELRAYVPSGRRPSVAHRRRWPSEFSVAFDTESTTDPSQRLRFGAYQLRRCGRLFERGLFYGDDLTPDEIAILASALDLEEPSEAGERLRLRSRAEFIEHAIYAWGLDVGALIIGFNLPFDISRVATGHTFAKGKMRGGFSFALAAGCPNIRVKHLSRRAAFIQFAGGGPGRAPDRGFFVDVKTLAAALTSGSHSLESLTRLLGTPTQKSPLDDYSGPITIEMVRYCLADVQATWECFAELAGRYEAHGLTETGLFELYSEASLGKAFLRAMNVKPWLEGQRSFPPEQIGRLMGTYYGGRAEVHIRREIVPVIHCDFRSMYPSVCTLLGLWRFVIAECVIQRDATEEVRQLVQSVTLDRLQRPETWRELSAIVQIAPDDDCLPVRAAYPGEQHATIGLNRFSAPEPMWFTLPDVLASALLTGRPPKVLSAIRFEPGDPQAGLRTITLEGEEIDPQSVDFYKWLIDRRGRVQEQERQASPSDRPALSAASQALKILANSTSYGIFMELNVRRLDAPRNVVGFDFRGKGTTFRTNRAEDPGPYFHPLLGTLITGGARLMLALAERNAADRGLDWAFCDTDSLAIANTAGLSVADFIERVQTVRRWFEPLNPYEMKGSLLQLEKVNFPAGADQATDQLRPVSCLAISAKRYVLFDRDEAGEPIIRKASAHGLGHLLAPYPDPDKAERIKRIGVELWQEDLWRAIIKAHDAGRPDSPDFDRLPNFDLPAASRYAATNRAQLGWFDTYNEAAPETERVGPFNFLLTYQAKSGMGMAALDPEAGGTTARRRGPLRPTSRYSSDLTKDPPPVFDRQTGEAIPWTWLKSYARSLARHHLHSEAKFRGGYDSERGTLRRRRVEAFAFLPIGKEADNLEERQLFGEGDDDAIEWVIGGLKPHAILAEIEAVLSMQGISERMLVAEARVSHHTLADLRARRRVNPSALLNLARAAEALRQFAGEAESAKTSARQLGLKLADDLGGVRALAAALGVTHPTLGRMLKGEKPLSAKMGRRLRDLADQQTNKQPSN